MSHDEEVSYSDQVELLPDFDRARLGLLVDVKRRCDNNRLGAIGST